MIHASEHVAELKAEIERLREEARRYYRADGSFEVLASAEEVVERRKQAARELDALTESAEHWKQRARDIRAAALAVAERERDEAKKRETALLGGLTHLLYANHRFHPEGCSACEAVARLAAAPLAPRTETGEPAAVPYTGTGTRESVGQCPCGGELVRFVGARTPQAQCLKCKEWRWPPRPALQDGSAAGDATSKENGGNK